MLVRPYPLAGGGVVGEPASASPITDWTMIAVALPGSVPTFAKGPCSALGGAEVGLADHRLGLITIPPQIGSAVASRIACRRTPREPPIFPDGHQPRCGSSRRRSCRSPTGHPADRHRRRAEDRLRQTPEGLSERLGPDCRRHPTARWVAPDRSMRQSGRGIATRPTR